MHLKFNKVFVKIHGPCCWFVRSVPSHGVPRFAVTSNIPLPSESHVWYRL